QGQFWKYHDELYRRQASWAPLQDPAEALEGLAEEMGMDADDFGACLKSDKHAELIWANLRFAETLGIPGTPTVLISIEGQNPRAAPGFDYESIIATVYAMTGSEMPETEEDPNRDLQRGGG
ncbi:MAG: DsbA family protein, partial [Longimicrobiales bacterium]|nr:DsbA family protein [Longimicrobiales bacterium]